MRRAATLTALLMAALTVPAGAQAQDSCPNAEFRVGPSANLPDCRAYELMSPGDTGGGAVAPVRMVAGGEAMAFTSRAAFAGAGSLTGAGQEYLATRGLDGWEVENMVPRDSEFPMIPAQFAAFDLSPDLQRSIWFLYTPEQTAEGRHAGAFYFVGPGGDATITSPTFDSRSLVARADGIGGWVGASEDFATHVFRTKQAVDAVNDTTASSQESLYELVGAGTDSPVARILGVNGSGQPLGPACRRQLGGLVNVGGSATSRAHAVAQDETFTTISFTAFSSATSLACPAQSNQVNNPAQVWVRRTSRQAPYPFLETNVSASRCTRTVSDVGGACYLGSGTVAGNANFEGASADGHEIFFSTARQLVNGDIDTGATARDIYRYDFDAPSGQELSPITVTGTTTPTDVRGVVRTSDDGSRVYFVAGNVLAANTGATPPSGVPQVAALGANNLYMYERNAAHPAGRTVFVAQLAAGDSGDWAGSDQRRVQTVGEEDAPDNGRYLLVTSVAQLVQNDTDTLSDIYMFDAGADADGAMSRVWTDDPAHNGTNRTGGAVAPILARNGQWSASWREFEQRFAPTGAEFVVLETTEPLSGEDTNNRNDVYLWRPGGEIDLISDGKDTSAGGAEFARVTPGGESIAFVTAGQLVASDTDSQRDAYVARVDGGFPEPVPAVRCDVFADDCQGDGSGGSTEVPSDQTSSGGNADSARVSLSVAAVSRKARARASKTGVLVLRVGSTRAGRVAVVAKGRLGKRVRRVGRKTVNVGAAGTTKVRLELSRAAKRRLRSGARLRLQIAVSQPDARARTLAVNLERGRS